MTSKPVEQTSDKPATHAQQTASFVKYGMIASLLLACIAIALSYVVWLRAQQQLHTSQQLQQQQLQVISSSSANQRAELNQRMKNLAWRLDENTSQTSSQRALQQANYFVRLANMTLSFGHNIESTQKLLKQADASIRHADDPALNQARQALLADISQLHNEHTIDVTGSLLLLNQIMQQVESLPVIPNQIQAIKSATPKTDATTTGWRGKLDQALIQLKSLVIIREHTNSTNPLIGPQQFKLVKSSVAWQLMQAQWAILHQSNDLYQQTLSNAISWLNTAHQQNPKGIETIVKQLKQLSVENASPEYPDLIKTLKLIDTTRQQLNNTPAQEKQPAASNSASNPSDTKLPNKTNKTLDNSKNPLKKLLPKSNKAVEI